MRKLTKGWSLLARIGGWKCCRMGVRLFLVEALGYAFNSFIFASEEERR